MQARAAGDESLDRPADQPEQPQLLGGRRVDRYISPHLVRFNERILKDGAPIDEVRLAACLERCEAANRGEPVTFFEITTAAAFLAFLEEPADWVLLETGLGGRLDATNVVAAPRLCLISSVSMDHEGYLGDTIKAVHENESIYIPIGSVHRLANKGKIPLELIEVQTGSYFGEDDIERLDDIYKRT